MAITRVEQQVEWSSGNVTGNCAGNSAIASDVLTLDDTCVEVAATLKAEYTAGSPASDDIVWWWLLESTGDPDADADSADEYSTEPQSASNSGGGILLCTMDLTNEGETSGSGKKVIKTVQIPAAPVRKKIVADGKRAGTTNDITVSAQVEEMRSS